MGPNGQLLLFGTPDQPAVTSGQVVFETDHAAKGEVLEIFYSVAVGIEWRETAEKVGGGFTLRTPIEQRKIIVALKHPKPGMIKAGKCSSNVNFPIEPSFPSSMHLHKGFVARGENLLPLRVPESTDSQAYYFDEASNELVSSRTTDISYTLEVPTTTFMAGETIALAMESVPELELARDSVPVFSSEEYRGLLPHWLGKSRSQDMSNMPNITVCLKQTVTYSNRDRSRTFHEHAKFASTLRLDNEMGGTFANGVVRDGWKVVLKMTLPRLGANRVDTEKEAHDEPEGLKASLDNPFLRIDHKLRIKLKYDKTLFSSKVRKFEIPVTIVAPSGPGSIPFRFDAIPWSSKSTGSGASYTSTKPAKLNSVSHNVKLAQGIAAVLHAVHAA
ncbi:hypothetical protein BC939DRAFT_490379 [Gamsiella multidivaricata]|uniref:uncharacterized protein n=1 Tax=Gamsiella multidivaricata TaxID=101098 RepID=UPI0022201CD0|nr:uncharacterized protein BC939DRAFT_490379 [Gamsiella multidivaricata]KAI7829352.1 hypothetical protein BC939DRAFT_490379 [Gamsiella multidivaricata]